MILLQTIIYLVLARIQFIAIHKWKYISKSLNLVQKKKTEITKTPTRNCHVEKIRH